MIKKIKVAIADDHGVMREGLKMIIEGFKNFEVIYTANDGAELLQYLNHVHQHPSICILDISMPNMDGYETMKQLSEHFPYIHVLALSMFYNEFSIIKMLRLGAKGYIPKDADTTELRKALSIVATGNYYHPDVTAEKLFRKQSSENEMILSEREMEFMHFCCHDLSYREIADRMNVSTRTVHNYRDSLFDKLEIKTRVGLTIYALKAGLAV